MTMANDFDQVVARWLETDGPRDVPPGLVEAATAKARQDRQRRGVVLRLAGPSPWPTEHRTRTWMRRRLLVAAAVLVVVALAGTVVLVGARLLPPTSVPLLGRFTPRATMLTPQCQPQASLLLDGSILVVGASTARRGRLGQTLRSRIGDLRARRIDGCRSRSRSSGDHRSPGRWPRPRDRIDRWSGGWSLAVHGVRPYLRPGKPLVHADDPIPR